MVSTAHIPDLLIIGLLVLTAFIGFISGFTKLVSSLFAWGGALFFTMQGMPLMSPFVKEYVSNALLAQIITGGAVFIFTLSVFVYLSRVIVSTVKASSFKGVDRILGMPLSMAIGVVALSSLFHFGDYALPPQKYALLLANTKLAPYLEKSFDMSRGLFVDLLQRWFYPRQEDAASKASPKVSVSDVILKEASPSTLPIQNSHAPQK